MGSMELALTFVGIIYGIVLIAATFINNRFLGNFRLDVLFMPHPSDSTRMINLFAGLVLIGYNVYTLIW